MFLIKHRPVVCPSLLIALLLVLQPVGGLSAQAPVEGPRTSPKFSGSLREPPSREADALHLRLEVSFDWDKREVTGKVEHVFRAFKDLHSLTLDAVNMDVKKVTGPAGETLSFESLPETIRIDLGREVKRGEEIRFAIDYTCRPRRGVYFQAPDEADPGSPRQVWTQGETEENRHWIPCFDHPSDKLTTEVFVTAPAGMLGLSNGRQVEDPKPGIGGRRVFHWLQDKPHATYLITVVVGEFAEVWQQWQGIPLIAWVSPADKDKAERSFGLTADMVGFFSEKTGVPYPWAKYGQVCVRRFVVSGMENTSLTVLTDRTLHGAADEPDVDSVGLVAHELAHQWFGDFVTCRDWSDIWLNESFATFFESLYTEKLRGWDEAVFERMGQAEHYKSEDQGKYRRALSTRRWQRADNLFDAHSYPKGARILNMLRFVLGEDRFFAGIKRFLDAHAYGVAETSDFRRALEEVSGESLQWFFDQWVLSGGHPEYRVSWEWDEAAKVVRVQVRQAQKVDALTPLFRMPVEIQVVLPAGPVVHRVEVREASETFSLPAAERPRLVRFDPKDWILKDLQFPRARQEYLFELEGCEEVSGRIEALSGLGTAKDPAVRPAILKALSEDPFWGVRLEAARALRGAGGEGLREALAKAFSAEKRSTVRREIIQALGEFAGVELREFLRTAFAEDPSPFVAADALRALARIDPAEALPDALKALERDSYGEELRVAAIQCVAQNDRMEGAEKERSIDLLLGLFARGKPVPVRTAAAAALVKMGRGVERVYKVLSAAADDPSADVRLSVFSILADLGDRRAIGVLKDRRAKEDHRISQDPLDAIDSALKRLESSGDRDQLQNEVQQLRDANDRLERRMKALEERGAAKGERRY